MKTVHTDAAPQAVGPYSQAVKTGELVFTAGQVALDPSTGRMVEGDVQAQTRRVLANLEAVLKAAGTGLDRVVKTTIFLADMADFPSVNETYAEVLGEHRPARSTVQAAALPLGALVEIEAIALA
jgi:2-iminobutanoate/2-iminopropanoate deaminase